MCTNENLDEDTEGKLDSLKKELTEVENKLEEAQRTIKLKDNEIERLEGGVIGSSHAICSQIQPFSSHHQLHSNYT